VRRRELERQRPVRIVGDGIRDVDVRSEFLRLRPRLLRARSHACRQTASPACRRRIDKWGEA
jgi:hypothetical protein